MKKPMRRDATIIGFCRRTACHALLMAAILIFAAHPGSAVAGEKPAKATSWSYTQFEEPKSAEQPARLIIGLARNKKPLMEARCFLNEKAETISVTLYTSVSAPTGNKPLAVTFQRKSYKETFTGNISAGDQDGAGPRNVAIRLAISRTADFWNAMMALKGLGFTVNNGPAEEFTFVRGSEQRVSSFMQNCRSRSVGLNPSTLSETIISRIYQCEDGQQMRVDINVSGVAPKLKFSYKAASDVSLKATVEGGGITYSNDAYKLKMKGPEATLESNGKIMSCTGNAAN